MDPAILLDMMQIILLLLVPAVTVGSIRIAPSAWWGAWLVQELPEDIPWLVITHLQNFCHVAWCQNPHETKKSSKVLGLFSKGIAHDTILECIVRARSERICAAQESPASCCQQMVSETSGPPWCIDSKKSSNWQWYCGDTHPVIELSTR